jgi:SAM-dependent methyltransferase
MKKQEIEIWKEAQEAELAFWKSRERQGITLPPASLDRYIKCFRLFPLTIDQSTCILDVGSGPHGGVPFFITRQCFKVSCDPLIGKKGEFCHTWVTKKINVVRSMGEYLPFNTETVDFAFCINTLDHCYKPLYILKEINRVLKGRKGVLVMMVHVVTLKQKILHSIIQKAGLCKVLFANRFIRVVATIFFGTFLKLMFGLNLVSDGILHPFYFLRDDVVELLSRADFGISTMKLFSSPWNYKQELFVVARAAIEAQKDN